MDQRQRPAEAKHGATLLRIRAGALCGKRYCFRPCILKLGFASATYWAYLKDKRDLFRVMFYDVSFILLLTFCERHVAVCYIAL